MDKPIIGANQQRGISMKLNIAICDDDEAAIEYLKSCITHFYFAFDVEVSISTFTSGRTFLDSYTEKGQYQLIFMDVEMPELNGLDTASILRSTIDRYALLVFVSNYPEYMQKSFTVRAFYYLTKPYTTEDVEEVLKNAINESNKVTQSIPSCLQQKEKRRSIFRIFSISRLKTVIHRHYCFILQTTRSLCAERFHTGRKRLPPSTFTNVIAVSF